MSGSLRERRKWPRIPASSLPGVSASIVEGPDVTLVNVSRGGALLDVGTRYPMRAGIHLRLTRTGGEPAVVAATVSWAKVRAIVDGRIHYLVAVIFEQPIYDLEAVTGYRPADPDGEADPLPATSSAACEDAPPADPIASRPATLDRAGSFVRTDAPGAIVDTRTEHLRNELDAATADLATLTIANASLAERLEEATLERAALRDELDRARRHADEERTRLLEELAAARARADTCQAALDTGERERAQALADQQAHYEALIAELVEAANDQHSEYQHLLAEQTAAHDAERARANRQAAQLADEREAAAQQIHALERCAEELDSQIATLDTLYADQQAQYQNIRREAGRLVLLLASATHPACSQPDDVAVSQGLDATAHAAT